VISVSVPPAFGPEEGDRADNVGPPVGVQGAREILLASGPTPSVREGERTVRAREQLGRNLAHAGEGD
jgi:hypothetical protein